MDFNAIDTLAVRAVAGDRRAVDRLFRAVLVQCAPALCKFRYRFQDQAEADSAAAIAFLDALRKWQHWSGPFVSFFITALESRSKEAARCKRRQSQLINGISTSIIDQDRLANPHEMSERKIDRTKILSRAAAALSGLQRDVFEAVRSGEQQTEIARRLGVSVQNINQIFARALDRVRDELALEIATGA